jgi:DNA-binding transcriptional MerR regulator
LIGTGRSGPEKESALDKAPDAFRTISEVADDLDVPQHVLRFWETRFNQIKPMKRSGGRRYYRPDDVDLLRGIRHLLYGQGYTIRGVQRILKEQGIKAVQNWQQLVAASGHQPQPPHANEVAPDIVASAGIAATGDEDLEFDEAENDDASIAPSSRVEPRFQSGADVAAAATVVSSHEAPESAGATAPAATALARLNPAEVDQLQSTLEDLIACRKRLDAALAQD